MQVGDKLNQRYTLTALLGSGAMGDVFQATDSKTDQTVAVKVLDRKLTLDPDIVERFKREGEALRQLRHRHIVSFVDTFQHEGQQVIVMEYVAGGSLHQLIRRGPLPVEQARQMAIDLCDALTSAHRLNIIHRDIKPENVLIGADGTPKLTDFGVARLVSEGTRLTGTGTQIGTPFYMSPEAWQGQPLDAQADIWSLGIMLYEMLTGDVPFGGDTLVAVMNKVLTAPLPDLKKLRPDTPPALAKIVRRMLERDKAKRYQSLREVGLDLERVSAAPSTVAAPPAPRAAASAVVAPVGVTGRTPPETRPPSPPDTRAGGALPGSRVRWALGLGGLALAIVLCLLAAGGGGALALKMLAPASPATPTVRPSETAASPAATPTVVPPTPTPNPSNTPVPPIPNLAIGSTQVSPQDGMVQVYVPEGNFVMGSADSDVQAASDEKPQHTVHLDAFWIDQTDVTNAMYAKCVASGKCQAATCHTELRRDQHPAVCVDWSNAKAYCEGAGRRLPTEAEWEKAARGTDGRLYPWGNQVPDPTRADYLGLIGDTTIVGTFSAGASPYGALDMAGNVWEWVSDWYDTYYYLTSPVSNPPGAVTGSSRVVRGGSWLGYPVVDLRGARRSSHAPASQLIDVGFRCAASPSPSDIAVPPTDTPVAPSDTPLPSDTPAPTYTSAPSALPTATPNPTATLKPSPAQPLAPPTPTAGVVVVVVHLNTQGPVAHLYWGCADGITWSGDQYGVPMPPGTYTWTFNENKCGISLKAEDENHQIIDQQINVFVNGTYDWYVGNKP